MKRTLPIWTKVRLAFTLYFCLVQFSSVDWAFFTLSHIRMKVSDVGVPDRPQTAEARWAFWSGSVSSRHQLVSCSATELPEMAVFRFFCVEFDDIAEICRFTLIKNGGNSELNSWHHNQSRRCNAGLTPWRVFFPPTHLASNPTRFSLFLL